MTSPFRSRFRPLLLLLWCLASPALTCGGKQAELRQKPLQATVSSFAESQRAPLTEQQSGAAGALLRSDSGTSAPGLARLHRRLQGAASAAPPAPECVASRPLASHTVFVPPPYNQNCASLRHLPRQTRNPPANVSTPPLHAQDPALPKLPI